MSTNSYAKKEPSKGKSLSQIFEETPFSLDKIGQAYVKKTNKKTPSNKKK